MSTRDKAFYETSVPITKSREAIDRLLMAHGAEAVRWTQIGAQIILEFKHPDGSFAVRAERDMGSAAASAQRERQVWRALHWHIKAKFDAIDFGLEDTLTAFMPYLITAPNRVLIDDVRERRADQRLGIDVPLLPEGRA